MSLEAIDGSCVFRIGTNHPGCIVLDRRELTTELFTHAHAHRDMFGAPDVLIRKDKDFLASYTGVPSATDDDLAPGAG